METCGSTLSDGKKARYGFLMGGLNLPVFICWNPPHVVMDTGPHRTEIFPGVEIDILFKKTCNFRQFLCMNMLRQMPQIDPDMLNVVIGIQDAPSLPDFRLNGPRDQITGGELLHFRGIPLHKRFHIFIPKDSAYRTQGFTCQNTRADDTGGMKLDGFGIHDRKPCLKDDSNPVSGILAAIGRHFEHLTASAGGENRCMG